VHTSVVSVLANKLKDSVGPVYGAISEEENLFGITLNDFLTKNPL
jgi:hypothetical protein